MPTVPQVEHSILAKIAKNRAKMGYVYAANASFMLYIGIFLIYFKCSIQITIKDLVVFM